MRNTITKNMKDKKIPEWKQLGFKTRRAYEEWSRELAEDIRHEYC